MPDLTDPAVLAKYAQLQTEHSVLLIKQRDLKVIRAAAKADAKDTFDAAQAIINGQYEAAVAPILARIAEIGVQTDSYKNLEA